MKSFLAFVKSLEHQVKPMSFCPPSRSSFGIPSKSSPFWLSPIACNRPVGTGQRRAVDSKFFAKNKTLLSRSVYFISLPNNAQLPNWPLFHLIFWSLTPAIYTQASGFDPIRDGPEGAQEIQSMIQKLQGHFTKVDLPLHRWGQSGLRKWSRSPKERFLLQEWSLGSLPASDFSKVFPS